MPKSNFMKLEYPLFFILNFFCSSVFSQNQTENFPPPENQQKVEAIKASDAINVDGYLNESDWSKGTLVDDFF